MMPTKPILIFFPTYNEAEHIELLYQQVTNSGILAEILFLDDNSPDGTGEIIDGLVAKDPRVHVIHRSGKLGIGSAHLDGIRWAYDHGFSTLITMDCDLGHSPKYFQEFFKYTDNFDVVIGSRHKGTEGTRGWSWFRKILTKMGYLATTLLLNMPYDSTIAFRLYRLDHIPRGVFDLVRSKGYAFFFESLYIIKFNGHRIAEFPIYMPQRTYGKSKMTGKEIFNSFKQLFVILLRTVFQKKTLICDKNDKPSWAMDH